MSFTASSHVCFSRIRLAAALALAVAAPGCFVVLDPRDEVETPAVTGRLVVDGTPAADRVVRVSPGLAPGPCGTPAASARTGPDGHFDLDETRVHRVVELVPLAPSTPVFTVVVCAEDGGAFSPLYEATFRGWLPQRVDLACDLGKPEESRCTAEFHGRQSPGWQGVK